MSKDYLWGLIEKFDHDEDVSISLFSKRDKRILLVIVISFLMLSLLALLILSDGSKMLEHGKVYDLLSILFNVSFASRYFLLLYKFKQYQMTRLNTKGDTVNHMKSVLIGLVLLISFVFFFSRLDSKSTSSIYFFTMALMFLSRPQTYYNEQKISVGYSIYETASITKYEDLSSFKLELTTIKENTVIVDCGSESKKQYLLNFLMMLPNEKVKLQKKRR